MKVNIVSDVDKLRAMGREKVFQSHLIGFWDGDECVIVKDRAFGSINLRLSADELVNYIAKSEEAYK